MQLNEDLSQYREDVNDSYCSWKHEELYAKFRYRCAICLTRISPAGAQYGEFLELSTRIENKFNVLNGVSLGVLHPGFGKKSIPRPDNPMLRCGTCQYSFFFPNFVALSPPKEVLEYIVKYITETDPNQQKPLYQVFTLLSQGRVDGLPDPMSILPFLGLYSLVPLRIEELASADVKIYTPLRPDLSIYREGHWLIAPFDEVLPDNALTARIYDAASLSPDHFLSNSFGIIPLVEEDPEFDKNHFWRLPVDLGVVLAAFLDRAIVVPDSWSTYHVRLAKSIYALLYVQKHSWNGDTISSSLQPEKEKDSGRKRKR